MGGGNAQKSKMARERNLEKNKGGKGSQLDTNKKAMSIQVVPLGIGNSKQVDLYVYVAKNITKCKVCMQTFMCTTTEVKCREHAEAKHPKSDVYQCFPHLKK